MYLLLNSNIEPGEIFNLGGEERITIRELAQYIKYKMNSDSAIVDLPPPPQRKIGNDITHRSASLAKVKSVIGWEPVVEWKCTIDSMIADLQLLHHLQADI